MSSLRLPQVILLAAFAIAISTTVTPVCTAESPSATDLTSHAQAAFLQRRFTNAIEFATQAIAADAKNSKAWFIRGRSYSLLKQPARAIPDFSEAIKLGPASPNLYQYRGEDHFRLGHFTDSIRDFDRCLELEPEQKPNHWQRGISCYYAGQFEEGRKQFELHQTVNSHDVENAVWHFLCVTRSSGVEKARALLIPIEGDTRVPMSQVHQLFAGKLKPEDVLAAARAGNPSDDKTRNQVFYANLYLGLYFEAVGDTKAAREYIFKAAADSTADHYMGDVARSHANVMRGEMRR